MGTSDIRSAYAEKISGNHFGDYLAAAENTFTIIPNTKKIIADIWKTTFTVKYMALCEGDDFGLTAVNPDTG